MDAQQWLTENQSALIVNGLVACVGFLLGWAISSAIRKQRITKKTKTESGVYNNEIEILRHDLRERLIASLKNKARLLSLHPVIPGNTTDTISKEGRTRMQCIDLILEDLPRDLKSQGIRMAEFLNRLSDNLIHIYIKDTSQTQLLIDAQPIILDVECAAHVGLIYNELIANALQYGIDPGTKQKINIILKERDAKLFISVSDNGIGMKVPYQQKFSFGLQLVSLLAQQYQSEVIINSRPGARVELHLSNYQKANREVFITPTQRIY